MLQKLTGLFKIKDASGQITAILIILAITIFVLIFAFRSTSNNDKKSSK